MGIDPTSDTYTEADNDGHCKVALFGGRTPKYIEVHISGVVLCPIATTPSPNGTFILTQFDTVRWDYQDADVFMQLELKALETVFGILGKPGIQTVFLGVEGICVDQIANDQIDCSGGNYGHSGDVVCYWGPGISP